MTDFPFKGNWLINYHPKEFSYPDILITLAKISDYLNENHTNFNSINIIFNKKSAKNYYFKENEVIFMSFCGFDKAFAEKEAKPCEPATFKSLEKTIKTISLLFPRLENDPRWKSMGLPAGQLFLASNLEASGFTAVPETLALPGEIMPVEALSAHMAGVSLYEDLLPVLRPFLARFQASYGGILAAGGPFPTLAPMAAIYHLPQVNLWVRGEAELALPLILQALNRGDAEAFFHHEGVLWQQPGVIAMAGFDRVNRPEDFSQLRFDLDFLKDEHIAKGLEMNFSRGCRRACVFCCRAQGTKFRKLPIEKAAELLKEYRKKVDNLNEAWKSPRPLSGPPPLAKGGEGGIPNCREDGKASPPTPPRCGMASPDASQNLGMALRTSPKGEGALNKIVLIGNPPPSPLGEGGWGMGPERSAHIDNFININDDDILQEPAYAQEIFSLLKKNSMRIFGIQTSVASLVNSDGSPKRDVLDLIADPGLFVEDRPLLWLGTDAFLPARARRLGKKLPPGEKFAALLAELEKRNLRHFHYWISSDDDSSWEEFVEELALIFGFFRDFPGFGLLAHAPFIVPYPASQMFGRLPAGDPQLKFKLELNAADPRFSYKVVDHLETQYPQLNNLLNNEKAGGEKGFFDFLKEKDLTAAAQLAYHFLKQEELQSPLSDPGLRRAQKKLEETIAELLEFKRT